jgi:catechol 2,3-dioxygenase-like lactoylglutathione lyase family enzyme
LLLKGKPMITSVNHLSFTVSNLNTSVSFYEKVLGLTLVNVCERDAEFSEKVTGIKGAHLKIAYLGVSNGAIELIEYISPQGKKLDTRTCNVGSAHICFNVDDFFGMVDFLRRNKVVFSGEVCDVPAGPNKGKHVLYFKDPDSNTIEMISNEVTDRG